MSRYGEDKDRRDDRKDDRRDERRDDRRDDRTDSKKLILFDLHGVLVHTTKRPGKNLSVVVRPGLDALLDVLLCDKQTSHNFSVGIWTSAMEHNASVAINAAVAKRHREKISVFLCREDCVLCPTSEDRYATIKDLSHIWKNGGGWDAKNTVLIDDTPEKGARQPRNVMVVPSFVGGDMKEEDRVFRSLRRFMIDVVMPSDDVRDVLGNGSLHRK